MALRNPFKLAGRLHELYGSVFVLTVWLAFLGFCQASEAGLVADAGARGQHCSLPAVEVRVGAMGDEKHVR